MFFTVPNVFFEKICVLCLRRRRKVGLRREWDAENWRKKLLSKSTQVFEGQARI